MELEQFFELVPKLRMQDPLARLLGGVKDGIFEYSYADAVRLAGHSCPTVASAYWLTYLAMQELYPDSVPQRGDIAVEFRDDARAGDTGVTATIVQMLTGAAGGTGFKGISGRHGRVGLIRFVPELLVPMTFKRTDTSAMVEAAVNLSLVPPSPAIERLLTACLHNKATVEERHELTTLWQRRVKQLLLDFGNDPLVFTVRKLEPLSKTLPPFKTGWSQRTALPAA